MSRKRIDITVPFELLQWIDEHVKTNYRFRNRSHFFESITEEYRAKLE